MAANAMGSDARNRRIMSPVLVTIDSSNYLRKTRSYLDMYLFIVARVTEKDIKLNSKTYNRWRILP